MFLHGIISHPFNASVHYIGDFTSPPDKRYHLALIDWYDLVDRFSLNEYDAMLEDLGFKDGTANV